MENPWGNSNSSNEKTIISGENPWGTLKPQETKIPKEEEGLPIASFMDIPRLPLNLYSGVVVGAGEILNTIESIESGITGGMVWDLKKGWIPREQARELTEQQVKKMTLEPQTGAQSLVQTIGQFGAPYKVGAKLALKGLEKVVTSPTVARYGAALTGGAVADVIAFDPVDPNLSNLINENNELLKPIHDLLATNPNDPEAINRFRRAVEGLGFGVLADGILHMVGRGFRAAFPVKKTLPGLTNPRAIARDKAARELVEFDEDQTALSKIRELKGGILRRFSESVVQGVFDFALGGYKFDKFATERLERSTTIYQSFRLSENMSNLVQTFMHLGPVRHNSFFVRKRGGRWWVINGQTRKGVQPYSTREEAKYAVNSLRNNADLLATGGKSLEDALRPVLGSGEEQNFALYALSKRMNELEKEGYEVSFSKEQRKMYTDYGEKATFQYEGKTISYKDIEKDLKEFNANLLHFAVDSGLLSYQAAQKMLQRGIYLPLYRYFEEASTSIPGREIRFGGSKGKLKYRLKGAGDKYPIDDPIRGLIANMASILQESVRNRTRRDLYDTIDELKARGFHEVNDWAERIDLKLLPQYVNVQAIKDALKKAGIPVPKELEEEDFLKLWARNKNIISTDVDIVFRNGKANFYRVKDPLLQKTVAELGPRAALKFPTLALRAAQGFKHALTTLTTLSPDFLAKNTIRDAVTAWGFHKHGSAIPMVETLRGMAALWKHDKNFIEWHANGGGNLGLHYVESGVMSRRLRKLARGRGLHEDQFMPLGKLLTMWSNLATSLESANRYREYTRGLQAGIGKRVAALASREITTDFGLHGSWAGIKLLTSVVPFLNAGMQGAYRFARGITRPEERKQIWLRAALGIFSPTIGLWYLNRNLPEYQNLPEEIKDTNWVIPTRFFNKDSWSYVPKEVQNGINQSKYPVLLIPKPFELGSVASVIERGADSLVKHDPAGAMASMERIIIDMFRLSAAPQIVAPWYDVLLTNENWQGSKIVPEGLKDRVPWQQFTPYTSDTMVQLEDKVKTPLSPIQLEYIFNQYAGSIGAMALDVLDYAIARPVTKGVSPTPRLTDLPLFKSFYRDDPYPVTPERVEFFRIANQVDLIKNSYSAAKNDPVLFRTLPKSVVDYLTNPQNATTAKGIFQFFGNIKKQASDLDEAIGYYMADPRMNSSEKRKKIDLFTAQKNELFKKAMEIVNSNSVFEPLLAFKYKRRGWSDLNLGYHLGRILTPNQSQNITSAPVTENPW